MASSEALWNVKNPVNISFRPLTGGMRPDKHPASLSETELLDAQGVVVQPEGLERSPGLQIRFAGLATSYPPGEALIDYTDSGGNKRPLVVDSKFVYEASSGALMGRYYTYSIGTVRTSGLYAIGTGTAWISDKIKSGDILVLSTAELEIYTVDSNTQITLSSDPGVNFPNQSYEIRRAFSLAYQERLDYALLDNRVVFTDRSRAPVFLSGTFLGNYSTSMLSLDLRAGCVCYHADRLWFGDITIGSTRYPQRIIWSKTLDHTDFGILGAEQFVDRPYSSGRLLRLLPLGPYLVAYYEDAIDFGRPTNIAGDSLPIAFSERLNTGGMGLLGPRAVCSWVDGHFFVSQNGVYFLSLSRGLEQIDNGILYKTIRDCAYPGRVYAEFDRRNNRIVFGFSGESDLIEQIYSYNLITKAWSRELVQATVIGKTLPYVMTIGDLDSVAATIDDLDSVSPTIQGLGIATQEASIMIGTPEGRFYSYEHSSLVDAYGNPVQVLLETGDIDLNSPDKMKSAYRLSLRASMPAPTDLPFTVQGSVNSGDSWRTLGTLTVEQGTREGFVNFQITGSVLRFRILSSGEVPSYTILEIVIRFKGRGVESYYTSSST